VRTARSRTPGPKPAPLGRLSTAFRKAVSTSGAPMGVLATLASFPSLSHFSTALWADRLSLTPTTVQRLRKLADAIHFRGVIFEVL
jgi:hypothetical protein